MILTAIIACEVGFWIFLFSGMAARYLFKRKKLGTILLILTPAVDVVLLILTVADLRRGAEASIYHGLAAVYIGVSVAFGHRMVQWADELFSYRFAGGPAPAKPPRTGKEHARYERQGWYRHLLAWLIGSLLLLGMVMLINDNGKTLVMMQLILRWGAILLIDFIYSFSFTLWPRQEKKS